MRVLHFYKTYLSETVGGIEQVIFQLCESSGSWGIDNHVLTLSSDPHPPVGPSADMWCIAPGSTCSSLPPGFP